VIALGAIVHAVLVPRDTGWVRVRPPFLGLQLLKRPQLPPMCSILPVSRWGFNIEQVPQKATTSCARLSKVFRMKCGEL
jgi:hypothetical protein